MTAHGVVVKSIAYDESLRQFHADIFYVQFRNPAFVRLEGEGTYLDAGRPEGLQALNEEVHAVAGLDDVFDNDDMPPFDIFCNGQLLLDTVCRCGALIAGNLSEGYLAGACDSPHQIGSKQEGSVKDNYENRVLVSVVGGYAFGTSVNGFVNLLFCYRQLKGLVSKCYAFFHFYILSLVFRRQS